MINNGGAGIIFVPTSKSEIWGPGLQLRWCVGSDSPVASGMLETLSCEQATAAPRTTARTECHILVSFISRKYPNFNLSRPLGRSEKIGPSPRHELEFLVRHTLQHAAWPCKHVLGCGSVGFKAMTDIDEPLVSSFFGIYRVWFVIIASHGKIGGNEWFFGNYPISWSTSY